MLMERRKRKRSPTYEVVDVELAYIYYAGPNEDEAKAFKESIELIGHRAIIKEIK